MENQLGFPSRFDEYDEKRREGFIKVKELKDRGENICGIFCTYTPIELIYGAGAIPFSLCGTSNESTRLAERDLPKNLCPLIKSSYGFAISDQCPYFYFADLIVGETTCDGKKKMYEHMGKMKDTYVISLPQKQGTEDDYNYLKNELIRFKEYLEEKFQCEITDEILREEIEKANETRQVYREFFELGKLHPSPLSGYESNIVTEAASFTFDRTSSNEEIREKTKELYDYWENKLQYDEERKKRPRIMITGCPTVGVRNKVLKNIEDLGADIVVFESCNGVREKMELVDPKKTPMDAITEKYLGISCSVMSPNPKREIIIEELVEEYQVDAVIEVVLQACHTFAIEAHGIEQLVQKRLGKPYMYLETDYSENDAGQIRTRIEAFIEMLQL
ncbi:MAG: double-cubane-cluster-containing anaerobic reductase [Tissierellia bacterium]|nr:double-cubane-cluster-containing anaerobic reductase [Tissierellia bacterium]